MCYPASPLPFFIAHHCYYQYVPDDGNGYALNTNLHRAIEVTAGDVADVVGGTVVGREVNSTEIVGEYVTVSTEGIGTEVADADVVGITFIATEVDGAEVVGKETVDEEAVGKEITSWQFTTAVLGW
eukprot:CAMPEP_0194306192 /NCGR_PEP_ID=MMETSP0171-20130528/3431_1 /TAXON_ID=218684 /ORGANISM="Corethron pennatum, Strain L29A3" /LENGTH=126 /DNA_ID=CAMNT_0039057925 /DNA_START=129 /DNA_END=507 /DNA_ORIENTATION=+